MYNIMVICPLGPHGHAQGRKCFWSLAEAGIQQLLGGFTPNQVNWNCLGLWMCNITVICPLGPHLHAHGLNDCSWNLIHRAGDPAVMCLWDAFVNSLYGDSHHQDKMVSLCNFNSSPPGAAYMHQWTGSALVQIMAWCLFGTKPLPEPMLTYLSFGPLGTNQWNLNQKTKLFIQENAFEHVFCEMASILSKRWADLLADKHTNSE